MIGNVGRAAGIKTMVVLTVAACAGLSWYLAHPQPAPIRVVLITLDTTRADRLPAYGFMDASMPHLDRLAREGVVFDQATSVGPLTLPAHCSLFTGLLPPAHGVRDNGDRPLAAGHTTLAEVLRTEGFRTAAFVGSAVLDPDRGLNQGFERYRVGQSDGGAPGPRQRRADEVIDEAISWLDDVEASPFFLWAHLYDAHRPYEPPEPYRSRYLDPYVGEIAFADSQVGRLMDALDHHHLLDRTIVIAAGDHGESLGEHGERDHGIFVYESVLRVPLIVRAPAMAPRRVAAVVRLIDVMPTVLDLLGVPALPSDGVSLVDLMSGTRTDLDLDAFLGVAIPAQVRLEPGPLAARRTVQGDRRAAA